MDSSSLYGAFLYAFVPPSISTGDNIIYVIRYMYCQLSYAWTGGNNQIKIAHLLYFSSQTLVNSHHHTGTGLATTNMLYPTCLDSKVQLMIVSIQALLQAFRACHLYRLICPRH